jgi:hypothetical protein
MNSSDEIKKVPLGCNQLAKRTWNIRFGAWIKTDKEIS